MYISKAKIEFHNSFSGKIKEGWSHSIFTQFQTQSAAEFNRQESTLSTIWQPIVGPFQMFFKHDCSTSRLASQRAAWPRFQPPERLHPRKKSLCRATRDLEDASKRPRFEYLVVGADVENNGQTLVRRHSSHSCIQRQFSNWYSHAERSKVSQTKYAFTVGDDDRLPTNKRQTVNWRSNLKHVSIPQMTNQNDTGFQSLPLPGTGSTITTFQRHTSFIQ